MWDAILEALIDSLKTAPILFLLYLIIEIWEHSRKADFENFMMRSKKFGPLWGALLGIVPQCAFSVTMADLFSRKMITMGTLVAIFLSTIDEAIPIMLSYPEHFLKMLLLIGINVVVAICIGFLVDFIFKKQNAVFNTNTEKEVHSENENVFLSALKHTLEIFAYILIASIVINLLVFFIGEQNISVIFGAGTLWQPFVASLIGLIPNCSASVLLIELYLESGLISFGSLVAGLCTGAGIGLLILFKANKNLKQNLLIILILYLTGSILGFLLNLFLPVGF